MGTGTRTLLVTAGLLGLLALAPIAVAKVHLVETVATGDSAVPYAFSPQTLTIAAGESVRWVNTDDVFHTTTSRDGLWDGTLGSKDVMFEHTFTEPGTFEYRCNPHASFMTGSITVIASASPSDGQDSPGPGILVPLGALGMVAMLRRLS